MIITFPHMGPMAYVLTKFFNELNIEHVIPPPNDRDTLQAGIEISPEEMCLPFKFMVGNLKRAYELGADTVVMAATCGPCRLGEYCQLMMEIMEDIGYSYKWILLDSPAVIGPGEFANRFSAITKDRNINKVSFAKNILAGLKLINAIDKFRRRTGKAAGYLTRPYEAVNLLRETEQQMRKAETFAESFGIIDDALGKLRSLHKDTKADPVKVLVTGEIYTSIEKEANGRVEEKLMMLGCSVQRHLSISWWIRHTVLDIAVPDFMSSLLNKRDGIPCNIGGYGQQTVSKIIKSNSSFDGIIKIMPSGCMPEIVAKAFCEKLQEDRGYKILHLIYDEMSGDAGYQTRVEAFVDMLERRKHVLAGNRHRLHKYRSGVGK